MVFPTTLETGVGVAGPTADIGHAAAHATSGIDATLQRIQNTIGLSTATQTWAPSWKGTDPSTNVVRWNRVGNIIAVSYEFRWTTGYSYSAGGLSLWNSASFPWGGGFQNTYLSGYGNFVTNGTTSAGTLQLSTGGSTAYGRIMCYSSLQSTNSMGLRESAVSGSYFLGSGILVVL